MTQQTITFTQETVTLFKAEYDQAIKNGAESFMFDNNEFDTRYAGYLLEYLESQGFEI